MSFTRKNIKRHGGFQNQRNSIRCGSNPTFNFGRKKKDNSQYKHQDQLSEADVGISEYISDLEGYSAVIKARFSDFQVNEFDKEGRLAKLTQLKVPNFAPSGKSFKDTIESPMEKIPQDVWDALRDLIRRSDINPTVELEAENLTKDERKDIHQCIKAYFGRNVVASTIKKNEKTILSFRKWDKKEKSSRSEWPENTPEFVHFIVYKEMMDTMDACFKISQALKIPAAKIYYAGLKDRRAKTTQWCCVKKYQPAKLIASLRNAKNLKVGNIEFKKKCLKLGDLSGNRFRIALRNVQAEDELINHSLSHVKEHGFINYYGLQRFGNEKEVPTYLIGLKLLTGSWKEAVNLILKVKPGDDPSQVINTAKQIYADTGDAAKALKICDKRQNGLEKKLLEGLAKHHGNDYVNALESIPRSIRLMYIHAFQSLVWNKMASKRMKLFGLKPVEGDLVLVDKMGEEELRVNENDDDEDVEDHVTTDIIKNRLLAKRLTAEELHKYSIFDIVLPLPGFDIIYPENLKQCYKEILEKYSLTLEMPKQKVKTYNLSGTYRKLVQQVQNVEWKIMYYNNSTDNLIQSDLEELNGEALPESIEKGTYKAIVIAFTLNAASYATMVLREVLKCNTSSSSQAGLNNYDTAQTTHMDTNEQGSLLADAEKYKDFQKRVFSEIYEEPENCGIKRELGEEDNESQSKKTKSTS